MVLKSERTTTLVVLGVQGFVFAIMISMIGPFFPVHAQSLGLSEPEIGAVFSIFSLTSLVTSTYFGQISRRFGHKKLLICGIIGECSAFVLFGFGNSLWQFLVLRAIQGIAVGASNTATFALLGDHFLKRIGFVNGLLETVIGIGFMLGPPLGGWLLELGGFSVPFATVGIAAFVLLVFVLGGLPQDHASTVIEAETIDAQSEKHLAMDLKVVPKQTVMSPLVIMRIPKVLVTAGIVILMSTSLSVIDSTLALHLKTVLNLTPLYISATFFSTSLLFGVSSSFVGYLADRTLCYKLMMATGLMILGVSSAALGFWFGIPNFWGLMVVVGVLGLGASLSLVPFFPDMIGCTTSSAECVLRERDRNSDDKYYSVYGTINKERTIHDVDVVAPLAGIHSTLYSIGQIVGPIGGNALASLLGSYSSLYGVIGGVLIVYSLLVVLPFSFTEIRCQFGHKSTVHSGKEAATLLSVQEDCKESVSESIEGCDSPPRPHVALSAGWSAI